MVDPWSLPVWGGPTHLFWRDDHFGIKHTALYAGGLLIGWVRKFSGHTAREKTPWRAWILTDEDGREVGWYESDTEARGALVEAAIKELSK